MIIETEDGPFFAHELTDAEFDFLDNDRRWSAMMIKMPEYAYALGEILPAVSGGRQMMVIIEKVSSFFVKMRKVG